MLREKTGIGSSPRSGVRVPTCLFEHWIDAIINLWFATIADIELGDVSVFKFIGNGASLIALAILTGCVTENTANPISTVHFQKRFSYSGARSSGPQGSRLPERFLTTSSDTDVCRLALVQGEKRWDTEDNQEAIEEVFKRGFTPEECFQLVTQEVTAARTTQTSALSQYTDTQLCAFATTTGPNNYAIWDKKLPLPLAEVERREISLERCAQLTNRRYLDRYEIVRVERDRKLRESRTMKFDAASLKHKDSVAVIIGNKTYQGETPAVEYAHNDADAMKEFILNRLGYRAGNIIDLRDATRNQIENVFGNDKTPEGKLHDWIRPGRSDVIVFYSGHGVPGLRDRRPYLLPVDGNANRAEITGFPVDTLYKNLSLTPARSVTVYLDACFSGESPKGMLVKATSGITVSAKQSVTNRLTVITASQGDQLASWDETAKHGLFTKHLLDALYGAADGGRSGNDDGRVSLREVQQYLDDEMTYQAKRTWGRRQRVSVQGNENTILAPALAAN